MQTYASLDWAGSGPAPRGLEFGRFVRFCFFFQVFFFVFSHVPVTLLIGLIALCSTIVNVSVSLLFFCVCSEHLRGRLFLFLSRLLSFCLLYSLMGV